MPSLVSGLKNSISGLQSDLFSIKSKAMNVSQDICNLDDVITLVQISTQIQEDELSSLDTYNQNHHDFVSEVNIIYHSKLEEEICNGKGRINRRNY